MPSNCRHEKVYGWFMFGKPILAINDIELVKRIKVKDFNHFVDGWDDNMAKNQKLGGDLDTLFNSHMGNAKEGEWRDIRSSFSPIFTSGKMKGMLTYIKHVGVALTEEIGRKAEAAEEFEQKEVFGKFSLDALASCAFGVDAESFSNTESQFVNHAAKIFSTTFVSLIGTMFRFVPGVPQLYKFFNINVFHPKSVDFFKDIVLQTLKARKESKDRRNDLIDLILDCIKDENTEDNVNEDDDDQYHRDMKFTHKKQKTLDNQAIVSNLILLLVVGYDTTGMTLSYLAYAMSKNPDIQEKLQEEIDQAFEDADNSFPDYNTIQNMPYLDMIINETLRYKTTIATVKL